MSDANPTPQPKAKERKNKNNGRRHRLYGCRWIRVRAAFAGPRKRMPTSVGLATLVGLWFFKTSMPSPKFAFLIEK